VSRQYRELVGQRIVIHAGSRPVKPSEIHELIEWVRSGRSSLVADKALPLLERIAAASRCRGVVELGAGLGTAIIGKPRPAYGLYPDSDRAPHHLMGWPLTDVWPWPEPIEARGLQGFWQWPYEIPRDVPSDILAAG